MKAKATVATCCTNNALWNHYLADYKVPAAYYVGVAFAAARTVALILDYGKGALALPANALAFDGLYDKLRVLKARALDYDRVNVFHILWYYHRQIAYFQHYRHYLVQLVFIGKLLDRFEHLPYHAYFVHTFTSRLQLSYHGAPIWSIPPEISWSDHNHTLNYTKE